MNDLDRWADWMRAAGRSPATIRTRLNGMRTLCRHAGCNDPADLTGADVTSWLSGVDNPFTRFTYWQTVTSWSAWAVDHDVTENNPTAGLARPRSPRCTPRPVPDHVVSTLIEATPAPTKVWAALARHKPRAGQRGSTTVAFSIGENGALRGVRVGRSSGNSRIDQLALATVRNAAPFPPPPAGAASYSIRIDFQ